MRRRHSERAEKGQKEKKKSPKRFGHQFFLHVAVPVRRGDNMCDTTRSTFVSWPIVLDQRTTRSKCFPIASGALGEHDLWFRKPFFNAQFFLFTIQPDHCSVRVRFPFLQPQSPQNKPFPGFHQSVSYCDVSQSSGAGLSRLLRALYHKRTNIGSPKLLLMSLP